jgi:hypothetical protein
MQRRCDSGTLHSKEFPERKPLRRYPQGTAFGESRKGFIAESTAIDAGKPA